MNVPEVTQVVRSGLRFNSGSWDPKLCWFHPAASPPTREDSRDPTLGLDKIRSMGTQNQEGGPPADPGMTQELGWGRNTQWLVGEGEARGLAEADQDTGILSSCSS